MYSQIQKHFPEYHALQTIGQDPRLQASSEQALNAVGSNHCTCSIHIPDAGSVDLAVGLDYTQGIRDTIGSHETRREQASQERW